MATIVRFAFRAVPAAGLAGAAVCMVPQLRTRVHAGIEDPCVNALNAMTR